MKPVYKKFALYQAGLALIVILCNLFFPGFIQQIRYPVLVIVILIIGMPHGSLDHIVTYHSLTDMSFSRKRILFYGLYTLLAVAYGLLWVISPLPAFIIFLLITLYHFGQADAERFKFSPLDKNVLLYTRGFTIVALILYGNNSRYIGEIVAIITGLNSLDWLPAWLTVSTVTIAAAVTYPAAYFSVTLLKTKNKISFAGTADALLVPLLFSMSDTILAFAIYFGAWHSFNHSYTMLNYLEPRINGNSVAWFYKKTLLFSLISYGMLIIIYFLTDSFGYREKLVAILFILISVLTLPHIFVVELMYKKITGK